MGRIPLRFGARAGPGRTEPGFRGPERVDPAAIGIRHLEMPPGCGRHRPAWAPDRNSGSRPPAGRQLEIGRNAEVTTHRRFRPFKTSETDPEQNLGSDTFFHVAVDGLSKPLTVRAGGEVDLHYNDTIYLTPNLDHLHRFDERGLRIT